MQNLSKVLSEGGEGKTLRQPFMARLPHSLTKFAIVNEPNNRVTNRRHIETVNQQSSFAIHDHRRSATVGPTDNGFAMGHRFQEDNAKSFFVTRHDEESAIFVLLL